MPARLFIEHRTLNYQHNDISFDGQHRPADRECSIFSFIVTGIDVPVAGALYPVAGQLSPMFAGAAMSPSSFTVMSLVIAGLCALTALFGCLLWLAAYHAWAVRPPSAPPMRTSHRFRSWCSKVRVTVALAARWATSWSNGVGFAAPTIAVWFGWHSLFAEKTFAFWIPDFPLAFLFGVVFQYFTIKPMRNLSLGQGIVAALKADIASITAWQIGMYGMMALIQFAWFRSAFGGIAPVATPEF
jgi:hypothetical protein